MISKEVKIKITKFTFNRVLYLGFLISPTSTHFLILTYRAALQKNMNSVKFCALLILNH